MRLPVYLLLVAFLALGLVYDGVTPIFEAGDEQFHYPYVKHIADGHGLPLQDPDDVQAWRQEGSQPPLYYLLGALATFWIDTRDATERLTLNPHAIIGVPAHDTNDNRNMVVHTAAENFPYQRTTLAVHLIRWLSLLMGVGTVYATYHLAWRVTPDESTSLLAASFVAFNPMFVFLSAAVNNDNLVILLATLSLWQMIRIWQDGITSRRVVLLGALVGLACLSKLSALGLIGVAGLMLAVKVWQEASEKPQFAIRGWSLLTAYCCLFTPILLIAGWWCARNFMLYGDATGLNQMLAIVGTRQGTPQLLPLLNAEIEGLRKSTWGLFGGINVLAAPWMYQLFEAITFVARIGLLVQLYRWIRYHRSETNRQFSSFAWLVLWLLVLLGAWMRWTLITPATQGRLLFPAIATVSLVLALGANTAVALIRDLSLRGKLYLSRAAPRSGATRDSPARRREHTPPPLGEGQEVMEKFAITIAVALFLLALRVALFDIAPAYTPAPLAVSVPVSAARDPIRFGDALELVGVEMPTTSAHSGETINVTLYWKAVAPMSENYSVFVHLLDAGDLIIGQRDSYTGLGLRPTMQLRVGDIVRDLYRVTIDSSAIAPSQPQLRVGVYDFATGQRLSSAVGDNPAVGTLTVLASAYSAAPNPVTVNFEDRFALTGYQIDRVAVRASEPFTLTLFWRANGPAPKDYSIFTHVLGKNDTLWGQVDRQLPMTTWQREQSVQDVYVLQVKPDTPPDVYDIEIGAYDLSDNFKRLNVWGADGQFVGNRVLLRKIRVVR